MMMMSEVHTVASSGGAPLGGAPLGGAPLEDLSGASQPPSETATISGLPSGADTFIDEGGGRGGATTLGGRGQTVLPEVRSDGGDLVIVPRDEARYESGTVLGRGGMGEVALAHDRDIDRKVAVKRLLAEDNPRAVARFIDEVRTVGSLEHPNIVPIHDVGVDDDGGLFFVMKYVEGETLGAVIKALAAGDPAYHSRYTFERRLDLFAGLLRALHYAHSRGLVHRDIKPDNIMVGRFGEVILMDWGIAHRMRGFEAGSGTQGQASVGSGLNPAPAPAPAPAGGVCYERAADETVDGEVMGTPQYMSPEQALGEAQELDGRSDIYSAFVVLWELLTLRPYISAGRSAVQTLLAVQDMSAPGHGDPAYFNPHQDAVSLELRHFLQRGLQPEKNGRFPDAGQVLDELGRVRSGDFEVVCPMTFLKHNTTVMDRFMDNHPLVSIAMVASAAVAFVGGVGGWVFWAVG